MTGLLLSAIHLAIGITTICLVIAIHEFGHFLFAKLFGAKVPVFSIGFGTTLLQTTIGSTVFKLALIPLGGYVEILEDADMARLAGYDPSVPGKFFCELPYWQKLIIFLAGIGFNLLLGIVIFISLAMAGMPRSTMIDSTYQQPTIVGTTMPGSAGAKAGLIAGDTIKACNSFPCSTTQELSAFLGSHKGQSVSLIVARNGQELTLPTTIDQRGRLGILWATEYAKPLSFFDSLATGTHAALICIKESAHAVFSMFNGTSKGSLSGPIMIIAQIMYSVRMGFKIVFLFSAFISIGLAILNLIPIPVVDGGQVLMFTIEAIIRRRLPEKVRLAIAYASWALLLGLFAIISLKDILSLSGTNLSAAAGWFKKFF